MKKYLLIIAVIFLASLSHAQTNAEEVDMLQAAFGMEKKMIVASFVTPSDAQKDAFWKIYDEYEVQRKELGKQRFELLNLYAEEYQTMTSEQAHVWTSKVMDLQKKTDKLVTRYYKKVKSISDGILATQFYQVEAYILTGVRFELLDEIPFVQK